MTYEPIDLLKNMARHVIDHGRNDTMEYADDIMRLPSSVYYDEDIFNLEVERIFKRLPIILAPSCELKSPGDFKTMKVANSSILLARGKDNIIRGFINTCRHRGVRVENEACGNRSRFTCPFHGWSYGTDGRLQAVAAQKDFGSIDKAEHGLIGFPVLERAGLIWGIVNPESKLKIADFLVGYDDMLSMFGFENWSLFSKRSFAGPNWKLAYDGYLEYYHVPALHGDTFGTDTTNKAIYYQWGPHQHIKTPDLRTGHVATETLGYMGGIADKPESDWDLETLSYGVWTVFPCTSIASFGGGGRGVMISQILPGEHVGESMTTQYYVMENLPNDPEIAEKAEAQFAFLQEVVETQDLAQGYSAQDVLPDGNLDYLLLGRNELGNQTFHRWCKKVLDAETDEDLTKMFAQAKRAQGVPGLT